MEVVQTSYALLAQSHLTIPFSHQGYDCIFQHFLIFLNKLSL